MGAGGGDSFAANQYFEIVLVFNIAGTPNSVDLKNKKPQTYNAFVNAINDFLSQYSGGQWIDDSAPPQYGGRIQINGPIGQGQLDRVYRDLNRVLRGLSRGWDKNRQAYTTTGLEAVVKVNAGPTNQGAKTSSAKQTGPITNYMDWSAPL